MKRKENKGTKERTRKPKKSKETQGYKDNRKQRKTKGQQRTTKT